MPADGAVIGAATVSLGQSITAYSFFLPPLREVRRAAPNEPSMRGDVHMGQVAAGVVTVGVGIMLSYLVGSFIPLTVAATTAVMIAIVYETALSGERIFE